MCLYREWLRLNISMDRIKVSFRLLLPMLVNMLLGANMIGRLEIITMRVIMSWPSNIELLPQKLIRQIISFV